MFLAAGYTLYTLNVHSFLRVPWIAILGFISLLQNDYSKQYLMQPFLVKTEFTRKPLFCRVNIIWLIFIWYSNLSASKKVE